MEEALAANGLDKAAIDWLVPHQANIRIIQATARKLDLSMERVICTVATHGNTSAASVPWRWTSAFATGASSPASSCCCEAFGGGFTWGSSLVRL